MRLAMAAAEIDVDESVAALALSPQGKYYFWVGCIPYLSTFASAGRQTTASEDDDNYLER